MKNIHFLGIGGIGVSALAQYFLKKGYQVTGSDLTSSEITKSLEKQGIKIYYPKEKFKIKKNNLPDYVVFSPAVPQDDLLLRYFQKKGIKCQSYPEALGELTKNYFTIAICGTHGKSTTTSLAGLLLKKAGLDPTVILGTKLREFGNSNFRFGRGKFLVIEADEHFASFLNYWPKIIILTNMEGDHFDYYKNLQDYINAFKKFVDHLPKDGFLIANKDEELVFKTFSHKKNVIWYSLKEPVSKKIKKEIKIPGLFNISNALAVFKLCQLLRIPQKHFFSVIRNFKGAWRRMEEKKILLFGKKIILVHDYGHHPTEVEKTIEAIKEKYKKKRIFFFFQPHQVFRTKYFFDEFKRIFEKISFEKTILLDVYQVAGREKKENLKENLSQLLVKKIGKENLHYFTNVKEGMRYIKPFLKNNDVLLCMGAGSIYQEVEEIIKKSKI